MTSAPTAPDALATPALSRRLACFVYEGVLLFGVVMAAGLLYGIVMQQRHALQGAMGLRVVLFIVIGLYFAIFWTRSGQTLAMKTWRIRLLRRDGRPVPAWQAACRYLLAWMWFVPALLTVSLTGLQGGGPLVTALAAGALGYAGLTRLHPDRQYWHDVLCQTRLVQWPSAAQAAKP